MIAKPETIALMRSEAVAYAAETSDALFRTDRRVTHETLLAALRTAYLRGADAGYTAAKAEERKP